MSARWPGLSWFPVLLASAGLGLGAGAYHRTPLDAPSDTNGLAASQLTNAPLQRISNDVYALGLVRLDKAKRTVRFPATVNMTEGPVEYALVHNSGKVHESVLKTEANPLHIQLAWLLLTPQQASGPAQSPKQPRDLTGPRIRLWAQWRVGSDEKRVRLEDLITNTLLNSPMSRGPWVFSGSRVVEGTFLAERDGSIAAIIADPDALINNPRPGRDDDDIWRPNRALVPAVGTAVEVVIEPVTAGP